MASGHWLFAALSVLIAEYDLLKTGAADCFILVMQKMSSGDLNVKCIIYIAHVHNMKKHATERWSIISMTVNLPNSSSPPVLLHTSVFWAQWHSSCLFPGYTVHKSELPAVFASWDTCDSYFSAAS